MKILLLEDEYMLRKNIAKYLRLKNHTVDEFEDGKDLIEQACLYEYDFFLLDINTPNFNGFEILEFINSKNISTPTIFISSMTEVKEIGKGFALGCADYLKKPFELEELEIRIQKAAKPKSSDELFFINDDYSYNIEKKQLFLNGSLVQLPRLPAKVLHLLIKNTGRAVSPDELLEYLYPHEDAPTQAIVGRIRDLRKYIDPKLIKNIHSQGYQIIVSKSPKKPSTRRKATSV